MRVARQWVMSVLCLSLVLLCHLRTQLRRPTRLPSLHTDEPSKLVWFVIHWSVVPCDADSRLAVVCTHLGAGGSTR